MSASEMVLELLDCEVLNTWEYDFIMSVSDFDYLSDKQINTIEEIYKTYFG